MRALSVQGSYVGNLQELRELVALVQSGAVAPIPVEEIDFAQVNLALALLQRNEVAGRLVLCRCTEGGARVCDPA